MRLGRRYPKRWYLGVLLFGFLFAPVPRAHAGKPGEFEKLATLRGRGALTAAIVGPGRDPGSELVYASYLYLGESLEIISIEPSSGAVVNYPIPIKGEAGARSVAVGPDGNVYFGTLPHAHLLQLATSTGELRDLGRPSPTEEYIWDLAVGKDGRLYGGTYPGARLVRFDPATGETTDLGRMDQEEMYAHYVAAADDGFVYVGIGTRRMDIVAFNTITGEHRGLLTKELRAPGQARVITGADGKPYGMVGTQAYRLSGWTAKPIDDQAQLPAVAQLKSRSGKVLKIEDDEVVTVAPTGEPIAKTTFAYAGKAMPIFRVGLGPDRSIYGSSVLPARLFRWDASRRQIDVLGELGAGQVYSILSNGDWILMAGYACMAPLMRFDPRQPFRPQSGKANPAKVGYLGAESSWRPTAMVEGPAGQVFVGAVAPYGKLSGQVIAWDTDSDRATAISVLPTNSGAYALALAKGLLIIGTTIRGGGGTVPVRSEASLLAWDLESHTVRWSIEPVGGAETIEALLRLSDGRVLGVAAGKVFVVDPVAGQIEAIRSLPFKGPLIHGALAEDHIGRVWGLVHGSTGGVFALDGKSMVPIHVVKPPVPISAGMALQGTRLYFASGPDLYQYQLPMAGAR